MQVPVQRIPRSLLGSLHRSPPPHYPIAVGNLSYPQSLGFLGISKVLKEIAVQGIVSNFSVVSPSIKRLCDVKRVHAGGPNMSMAERPDNLATCHLIMPIFIRDRGQEEHLLVLPDGCSWEDEQTIIRQVKDAFAVGITSFYIFTKVDEKKKTSCAKEAYNEDAIIPRVVRKLKHLVPSIIIYTDIGLEAYGFEPVPGIFSVAEYAILRVQTLCYARSGVNVICVKDVKPGLVSFLRQLLTREGFSHVMILTYSACFTGFSPLPGVEDGCRFLPDDKEGTKLAVTYSSEHEGAGADMLLAMPTFFSFSIALDISRACQSPVVVFHVFDDRFALPSDGDVNITERVRVRYAIEQLSSSRLYGASFLITYLAVRCALEFRRPSSPY